MKKIIWFILSGIMLIAAIVSLINGNGQKSYNHPVYISEELSVSGQSDNIKLVGKLKNRSNVSVHVTFTIYIHDGRDNYATYDEDIYIDANSEYDLSGTYYVSGNVYYSKVYIRNCKIDGESVQLEYLENDEQTKIYNNSTSIIISQVLLCFIFLIIGLFVVYYKK